MFEYLIIMVITVFLPITIVWVLNWKTIKKHKRVFPLTIIGTLLFAPLWDYISIQKEIWLFTPNKILNVWLLGIPIEEWLLYISFTLLFSTITILLWEKWGVKK